MLLRRSAVHPGWQQMARGQAHGHLVASIRRRFSAPRRLESRPVTRDGPLEHRQTLDGHLAAFYSAVPLLMLAERGPLSADAA